MMVNSIQSYRSFSNFPTNRSNILNRAETRFEKSRKTEQIPEQSKTNQTKLTDEEKKEVDDLKRRDREVRAHEQAHNSAGGMYVTRGASFDYKTGPDGNRYAVGGEVTLDISEIPNDPEATMKKMQQIRSAALAPQKPSGQDMRVASMASRIETKAMQEVYRKKTGETQIQKQNQTYKNQQTMSFYFPQKEFQGTTINVFS